MASGGAVPKIKKKTLIFFGIGLAAGIAVALALSYGLMQSKLFQTPENMPDDNPFDNPEFVKNYEKVLRGEARYTSILLPGQLGFFNADASGGQTPYEFKWVFSDGKVLTGQNVTRSFDSLGRYTFDFIVTDANGGQQKSTNLYVDVSAPTS